MKRLLVVALCLAGCRQRGGLQLEGSAYRMVSQEGGGLLLPPPVVNRQLEFVIPVRAGAEQGAPCRVAGDAFELRIEGGKALLRLLKMGEWAELLAAPELLEQRKCLPAAAAIEVKQLLRATLPLKPEQSLYGAYGYRAGGEGLDLRAGVRLKLVRAHFDKLPAARKSALDGYVGLTSVDWDCVEDDRGRVGFRRAGVEAKPATIRASREDLEFGRSARALLVYRLLMLTHYLRSGTKRAALVIGASSVAQMRGIEKRLRESPGESCSALVSGTKGVCFSFEGEVTVSPEVLVRVNGEPKALSWGTTVKMLAGQAKTVTLRRLWLKKLRSVEVEADPGMLLNTMLVGGDELEFR